MAVKEADENLKDCKRSREIFREEATLRAAKRPALANHSRYANSDSKASSSTAPVTNNNIKRCPKLDDLE